MHYEIRYRGQTLLSLRTPLVNRAAVWEAIAETLDKILEEQRAVELSAHGGEVVFILYTTIEHKRSPRQ